MGSTLVYFLSFFQLGFFAGIVLITFGSFFGPNLGLFWKAKSAQDEPKLAQAGHRKLQRQEKTHLHTLKKTPQVHHAFWSRASKRPQEGSERRPKVSLEIAMIFLLFGPTLEPFWGSPKLNRKRDPFLLSRGPLGDRPIQPEGGLKSGLGSNLLHLAILNDSLMVW